MIVPLYGKLVEIVQQVDNTVLRKEGRDLNDLPSRHHLERHGAIRLGTEHELQMIKRLFAIFGMYAVGYYDLRIVGFPLHATAFRPITEEALMRNPFRVFTSVLRKDQITASIRGTVEAIPEKRNLFSPRLMEIIEHAENGMMCDKNADDLIPEALKVFRWHSRSTVPLEDYLKLKQEHLMIADIICFPSAHINHLTPRSLDINLVQDEMIKAGLPAKERIEGPPSRQCPILLRQTSFKALEELVTFYNADGDFVNGTHTARFGEVEQRGAAVTRKGRKLYDQLLAHAVQNTAPTDPDYPQKFDHHLVDAFSSYPDTWERLRTQGLVYMRYRATETGKAYMAKRPADISLCPNIEDLLSRGFVNYEPITYEDFLPLSAAGIFRSNLGEDSYEKLSIQQAENGLLELEKALGCKPLDEFDLYDQLQEQSIRECTEDLRLEKILL
ncbi:hypothetical protein Plec18170_006204 [Paecilomyces lecythidis]